MLKEYMAIKNTSKRVPPQNIDAEKSLLGSILMRSSSLNDIADTCPPDAFYVERHRIIYQAMLELWSKRNPIDLITLTNRLEETEQLSLVGDVAYLSELAERVPASTNATYYAELITKKWTLRNLIEAGDYLSDLGFQEKEEIEEVLDKAEKRIFAVTHDNRNMQKFVGIKELLPEAWERVEKLSTSTGEIRGVRTGFAHLDNKTAGLQDSDLIILAARPSMGKTSLSLDIARQAAVNYNVPVGYFSLEMSSQQLLDRMLSAQSRVDLWKIRTGQRLTEDDFDRIRDGMDKLSKAPIYIDDQPGNTILRMRSTARRLKAEHGLGLLIVDYLQLITTTKNYDSMVNQVTEISRSLKAIARELRIPVLALSQLSRAVEARGGKPRLSDLRDSGAIEQDADLVMFIHREDKYNEESDRQNVAEILIEKHRNGPTGKIELFFDADKATFLNMDNTEHSNEGFAYHKKEATSDDDFDVF